MTGRDDYKVVFSLAELDPSMGERSALLADTVNRSTIDDGRSTMDDHWITILP